MRGFHGAMGAVGSGGMPAFPLCWAIRYLSHLPNGQWQAGKKKAALSHTATLLPRSISKSKEVELKVKVSSRQDSFQARRFQLLIGGKCEAEAPWILAT